MNARTNDNASLRFLRRSIVFLFPLSVLREKTSDPHKALDNLERASGAATLWILLGIVIELGAVFWFSRNAVEMFIGVVANALIAFGLIFEYVVIGRTIIVSGEAQRESDEKIASLGMQTAAANKSAAQAMEEAAKARAAQEQLKAQFAWRVLPPPLAAELERRLALQPAKINVQHVANDPEALYFSIQIANIFTKAKWEVRTEAKTFGPILLMGIFIPDCVKADPTFVRNAFAGSSIGFGQKPLPAPMMSMGSDFPDAPTVFIGSKAIPQ